jgi:hypothetical protein
MENGQRPGFLSGISLETFGRAYHLIEFQPAAAENTIVILITDSPATGFCSAT